MSIKRQKARPRARAAVERPQSRSRAAAAKRRVTNVSAFKWLFHRGPDARWRWKKTDPMHRVIAESTSAFASYSDCVSDAERKGYRQWLAPRKLKALSFTHVRELEDAKPKRPPAKTPLLQAERGRVRTAKRAVRSAEVVALRTHRIP
jgi:hypothetical protein